MYFLIKGFIIGFSIALAIGPIAILCINRSLTKGYLSGFVSGLGAASADGVYGAIAAFGLTFISSFLVSKGLFIQIIGVVFLFYLGIITFIKNPQEKKVEQTKDNKLLGDYVSTFFLTITNPMTILSFTAVFAGLGLAEVSGNYIAAALLDLGFFLGSAFLYFMLSIIFSIFRRKIKLKILVLINRISGIIIMSVALLLLVDLIQKIF